ncbi:AKAP7 2'5' RNA ligase-like domain-containing protein [Ditylenchus destructor]|uniref:AKAP7 2'5' RNA ligase-like domain-containing protein n=1 Tax=Ditylenchus destructor TaxID=166010 RepID=A0AAD4NHQ4_9BILA|nr:AKAP7 2'5' RNA ligase-like domain-containing protein [Ditylenchus destructor]
MILFIMSFVYMQRILLAADNDAFHITTARKTSNGENVFVAIQIRNEEIKTKYRKIARQLAKIENRFRLIIEPASFLHVTISTMYLTNDQVESAKNALRMAAKKLCRRRLFFKDVHAFGTKTLYVGLDRRSRGILQKLHGIVKRTFKQYKIASLRGRFHPHMTIIQNNQDAKLSRKWKKFTSQRNDFGPDALQSIQLLQMFPNKQKDHYYKIFEEIALKKCR